MSGCCYWSNWCLGLHPLPGFQPRAADKAHKEEPQTFPPAGPSSSSPPHSLHSSLAVYLPLFPSLLFGFSF